MGITRRSSRSVASRLSHGGCIHLRPTSASSQYVSIYMHRSIYLSTDRYRYRYRYRYGYT